MQYPGEKDAGPLRSRGYWKLPGMLYACLVINLACSGCQSGPLDEDTLELVPEQAADATAAAHGYHVERVNEREDPTIGPVTFFLWDVRVTGPDGVARVLEWPVYSEPHVTRDSIFLFPAKEQTVRQLVIHRLDGTKSSTLDLPEDCHPYFGRPSVSPCGTMLAYYAHADDYRHAMIRIRRIAPSWPVVVDGEWIEAAGGDVPPIPPHWQSSRTVIGDVEFFHNATTEDLTILNDEF